MEILSNKSGYPIEDIMCVTSRIGNKKRRYLLCNKMQGKYLPVDPQVAFEIFDKLAKETINAIKNRQKRRYGPFLDKNRVLNILVIGFAETATAIGARIAHVLSWDPCYNVTFLPTTRETVDMKCTCEFREEHSHAVEQMLYGNTEVIKNADYIVFAEDEITTGNTICNCANILCNKHSHTFEGMKFFAASILNCQSDEEKARFENLEIEPVYLIGAKMGDDEYLIKEPKTFVHDISVECPNPREGVNINEYTTAIRKIYPAIRGILPVADGGEVIVLGTEECMYPAMILTEELLSCGYKAQTCATTRVPTNIGEHLKNRNKITSMYGDRVTYLYGMKAAKTFIIVTDGTNPKGREDILHLLTETYGGETIIFIHLI